MKILMYSDAFGGPTTTFIYNDLIGLSKHHRVKYLCTYAVESNMKYDDVVPVEYKTGPVTRKIKWILEKKGWSLSFSNKNFSKRINKIISDFDPELIQCNFGYEALRLTDNLSGKNKNIPLVINFLGYDASFHLTRPSYVRKLKQLSFRSNVFATCNTHFLKTNLESKGIYFRENRVIYTGVRLDFFDRRGNYSSPSGEFTFLQIATLAERKGQEVTLKAFKKLLDDPGVNKKLKLIIAGGSEDAYGERVKRMPAELGISEHVEFIDWINPDQARELMLKVNCFVHHSRTVNGRTEGIPTAISEAMAMELPVLSTYHAGIPELIENGVNGFLINENDVGSYVQCMKEVLSWRFLSVNREKVDVKFNIHKRIAAFDDYYKHIFSILK